MTELYKGDNRVSDHTLEIFEQIPYPILVHLNGVIIESNSEALVLSGLPNKGAFLGRSILEFLHDASKAKAIQYMMAETTYGGEDFVIINSQGKLLDVEIKKSYFNENGHKYTFLIIKDMTLQKKDLRRAARIQKASLTQVSSNSELSIHSDYRPREIVSGDFYHMTYVDPYRLIGIMGDVKGKGVSAALSTSAMKILFYDACETYTDIEAMTLQLNQGVARLLGEEYVAALLFEIDLTQATLTVSCAGMNEFFLKVGKDPVKLMLIEGTFLGMFADSTFKVEQYKFEVGDWFYAFSDGLLGITEGHTLELIKAAKEPLDLRESLHKYCNQSIVDDDMTWIVIARQRGSDEGK